METLGWDTLDHLIHNAAIGYVGAIGAQSPDAIAAMIAANLKTPLALTRLFFPHLERAHGSVCFIGSTLTGRATPDFALYTATKTGLADLARNLRSEWGERVRVQEIHPGPTRTGFHGKSGLENPPFAALFMTPGEVARGILHALETGRASRRYGLPSLFLHAARRAVLGERR